MKLNKIQHLGRRLILEKFIHPRSKYCKDDKHTSVSTLVSKHALLAIFENIKKAAGVGQAHKYAGLVGRVDLGVISHAM